MQPSLLGVGDNKITPGHARASDLVNDLANIYKLANSGAQPLSRTSSPPPGMTFPTRVQQTPHSAHTNRTSPGNNSIYSSSSPKSAPSAKQKPLVKPFSPQLVREGFAFAFPTKEQEKLLQAEGRGVLTMDQSDRGSVTTPSRSTTSVPPGFSPLRNATTAAYHEKLDAASLAPSLTSPKVAPSSIGRSFVSNLGLDASESFSGLSSDSFSSAIAAITSPRGHACSREALLQAEALKIAKTLRLSSPPPPDNPILPKQPPLNPQHRKAPRKKGSKDKFEGRTAAPSRLHERYRKKYDNVTLAELKVARPPRRIQKKYSNELERNIAITRIAQAHNAKIDMRRAIEKERLRFLKKLKVPRDSRLVDRELSDFGNSNSMRSFGSSGQFLPKRREQRDRLHLNGRHGGVGSKREDQLRLAYIQTLKKLASQQSHGGRSKNNVYTVSDRVTGDMTNGTGNEDNFKATTNGHSNNSNGANSHNGHNGHNRATAQLTTLEQSALPSVLTVDDLTVSAFDGRQLVAKDIEICRQNCRTMMAFAREILILAESDFSFSASLCEHMAKETVMVATSFESGEKVRELHKEKLDANFKILRSRNARMFHEVDACDIETSLQASMEKNQTEREGLNWSGSFDIVWLQLPHTGGTCKTNSQLIKRFLANVGRVLKPNGMVYLTLYGMQVAHWKVPLHAEAGRMNPVLKIPFGTSVFPAVWSIYNPKVGFSDTYFDILRQPCDTLVFVQNEFTPVSNLNSINHSTAQHLQNFNVKTIADLSVLDERLAHRGFDIDQNMAELVKKAKQWFLSWGTRIPVQINSLAQIV